MRIKLFVFSSLLCISSLYPQNYYSLNSQDALLFSQLGRISDARALGMGNAHSVLSDNYTATIMNPATLGLSRRITVGTSIGANLFRNDATFLENITHSKKTETFLNQFGIVFPLVNDTAENNIVLSIGYNQSNNFNNILRISGFNPTSSNLITDLTSNNRSLTRRLLLSYPNFDPVTSEYLGDATILNQNLKENGYTVNEGTLNLWSIGFAYEFAPNIFVGVSANYFIGSYIRDREFSESDSAGIYSAVRTVAADPRTEGFKEFYVNDIVDRVYNGVDFRFGVLYKFFNFISIGGHVKTPTIISADDSLFFRGRSSFATGHVSEFDSSAFSKFSVESPYEFTAAASVNLWFLTGSAEVTYIDYTQMRFTDGIDIPTKSAIHKKILEEYSQIFNLKAGAEFRLPFTGLSARAGAMYLPSPLKNDPTEFDRKFITLGLGINSGEGSIEFNASYVLGWWDETSGEYGPDIPVITRTVRSDNIIGSLVLRF
ncbi:MAG: hypothetical protein ACM339_04930 [Ignavibacteria bacterium]